MLLDLGGKSHDPNPKRKGGYTESTFEQAYMDGLIESVDCEHRPHLNYMLTPKGLDEAVKIWRSEEHTSELQSLMRISYAVFCLKKKIHNKHTFAVLTLLYLPNHP